MSKTSAPSRSWWVLTRYLGGEIKWSLVSHGLASLSNVVISLALARTAGASGIGSFHIIFTVYLIALGFGRQLIAEPLLAERRSSIGNSDSNSAAGAATIIYGVVVAAPLVTWALTQHLRVIALCAATLPALLLQDTGRYIAFRDGRAERAALSDGVWMIVSILGVPLILEGGGSTALAVWVAGGVAGGIVSMLWTRLSSARQALFWWRTEARSYGLELARAGVLYTIGTSGMFLLVGAIAGPAVLGSIRAALILLGPVSMLTTALGMAILPRMVENPSREDRRHLVRVQLWPPIILLGGLTLARPWLDRVLFGAESMYSVSMFFVLSVAVAAQVLATSSLLTLRADRHGKSVTSAHLMLVVGLVPIGLLASKADGLGAAVGMMGQWVLVAWSIHAARSRTDY